MTMTSNVILRELQSKGNEKPCYILHTDRVKENIERLKRQFASRYGNTCIAYSFKTNYLKRIVEIVASCGCMAQVVSPYEYRYAKKLNLFGSKGYVYNGVIRDDIAKCNLAFNGGYVNIDNIDELKSIQNIARNKGVVIPIGIRVNFAIGNGLVSRFGMDVDGKEFSETMSLFETSDCIKFRGFQCHIGTSRPVEYWSEKTIKMIELAKRYNAEYIDLGGGMYGPMIEQLAVQFKGHADYSDYAESVCSMMKQNFPDEDVKLILQPGTAVVGNTMDLLAHVTSVKNVRGQYFITVDTCSNHLGMICECRDIPATIIHDTSKETIHVQNATIAGCTCLQFDYIKHCVDGDVSVGDVVIFENVGAYSISAARQFIVPRISVIDADTYQLIRSAQDINDMFLAYLS